jgi:hypothetical protein
MTGSADVLLGEVAGCEFWMSSAQSVQAPEGVPYGADAQQPQRDCAAPSSIAVLGPSARWRNSSLATE